MTADTIAFSAQSDLQSARTIAAFVVAEYLNQRRFPSQLARYYALLLSLLPRIIPTSRYAQHLAEQAHGVRGPLPVDEAVAAHRLSVAEKMAMAFFKMSSSCACRRAKARS